MMQEILASKNACVYKRRIAIQKQSCVFEAGITTYEVFDFQSQERNKKNFLVPYLGVGIAERQFKKCDILESPLPITGQVGISGLHWGLQQVNEIKKFNLPIVVSADMGDPRRLKAYLRLRKYGFRLCAIDHEFNVIYKNTVWLNIDNAVELSSMSCLVFSQ